MTDVEKIEHAIEQLNPAELAAFRVWFAAYDAELWDRQLERDVTAGSLDALADAAVAQHVAGRTRPL